MNGDGGQLFPRGRVQRALPDDLPSIVQLRRQAGLPLLQATIMFLNGTRRMCYANAGSNIILSPISINKFLGELPSTVGGLVKMLRFLALTPPGQVSKHIYMSKQS